MRISTRLRWDGQWIILWFVRHYQLEAWNQLYFRYVATYNIPTIFDFSLRYPPCSSPNHILFPHFLASHLAISSISIWHLSVFFEFIFFSSFSRSVSCTSSETGVYKIHLAYMSWEGVKYTMHRVQKWPCFYKRTVQWILKWSEITSLLLPKSFFYFSHFIRESWVEVIDRDLSEYQKFLCVGP